ncbi:hypothetical protein RhiirA4_480720 [Rhizophagus irregularis]|uniref:C2H2-type domain-containing protein n=1 Tax=Rhizophagus irregularis TaxID=588596 RepID=A0A2I1HIE0_9GLOM|nr:hypothetical protein RhiirA4_480720 [Rhizophagus irregularis]
MVAPIQSSPQCSVCKKIFKSKRGLTHHEAIVRKYNILHNNFYKLPANFINEFKKTLVFLIHCQLPNYFNKMGMKVVTTAYASSKLAQIFDNENWGTRNYQGGEITLVVTNLDDLDIEENPLSQKRKLIYLRRKSRYKRGEVIIEWKPKRKKDVIGNKYEGGFLYMHFWITKKRIT